jgi:hypothetical protein
MKDRIIKDLIELVNCQGKFNKQDPSIAGNRHALFEIYFNEQCEIDKKMIIDLIVKGFLGKIPELHCIIISLGGLLIGITYNCNINKKLYLPELESELNDELVQLWLDCIVQNEIPRDLTVKQQWRYGSCYYTILLRSESILAEGLYQKIMNNACSKHFKQVVTTLKQMD